MRTKRLHMLTILLTAVMFLALSLNVYAAKSNVVTQDGITAQLITDQDSYEKADSVQVTVKVDNLTGKEVVIKTTVNVPDGVTVVSGNAVAGGNLEDSDSFTAPAVLLSAKDLAAAFGTVDTGDGAKLGLWALVCVLAIGVLVALSAVKKNHKTGIAMLLCVAMIGGMAAPALAADVSGEIELECTVDIEGTEAKVSAVVEYTMLEETEESTEGTTEAPTEESTEGTTEAPTEAPTDEPEVEPLVLHVSVGGVAVAGCSEETHYADIAAAQAALRSMDHSDKPVEVIIHAGTYSFSSKVTFEAQDSGSADYPVVYKAAGDGEVIFTGSKELNIDGFKEVTDNAVLERIPEEAREHVRVLSLEDSGIAADILNFRTRYEKAWYPLPMVYLYLNEERQTISRWPNDGFETATTILETGETTGTKACFGYDGSAPDKWVTADNVYVVGYLGNDYNIDWVKIDSIDTKENTITVSDKANYGIQVGARWYAANLLEEMDLPGEYYIDVEENLLYYYPAHELGSADKLELTAYDDAFISLTGASYIEFEGIHFTHTLADGIQISGSSNITVRDCEMNDIGGDAVEINGRNNKVDGCTIYETGLFGVNVTGGADRENYIPSNNVISNNHFWNYATQSLMLYKYAISLGRNTQNQVIGDVVEYNIFHGQPGAGAILYGGLDNQIRYNEMYALSSDCADAGIIYCGRRYYEAGNVISYNYIHTYGSGYKNGWEVQAIYFDDTQPFQTAIRNIIVPNNKNNTSADLMTGAYNTFSENIIVNSKEGWSMTDRNTTISSGAESSINTTAAMTAAILAKHPVIQTVKDWIYANSKKVPVFYNTLTYNLAVDVEENNVAETVQNAEGANITGNVSINDYSVFVDADNHDYRLTTEAMERYGFPSTMINETNFEMSMIGIQTAVEKPAEAFDLLYPTDGQTDVHTRDLWFKWEEAQFADEYEYVIATDAALTNVVKTGTAVRPVVEITGLENGKTYYFSVTAKNLSKQLGNEWACTEVYSFTTIAVEPLDYAALNEKLAELKALDVLNNISGTEAGNFNTSITDPYNEIIGKAEALTTSNVATQDDIDAMAEELAEFIETIGCYKNVGTAELLTADRKWTTYDQKMPSTLTTVKGGGQLVTAPGDNTMIYPTETLENHYIFQFRMTPGRTGGYMVIALRQQDLSKMPFKVSHGYGIVITDNGFELQRYSVNSAKPVELASVSVANGYNGSTMSRTTEAAEYTVEFGAVDTFDTNGKPGVRIYFKVNDTVVFDYIDTEDPQFGEGRFTAYTGGADSTLKLMPITEFEVVVPDGIYYTNISEIGKSINPGTDKYLQVTKGDTGCKCNWASSKNYNLEIPASVAAENKWIYADFKFDEPVESNEMIIEVRLSQNQKSQAANIELQYPYAADTEAEGNVTYSMNTLLKITEGQDWQVGKEGYKVGNGVTGNFAFKINRTSNTYTIWSKKNETDTVYSQLSYTAEDGTVIREFSLEAVQNGYMPTFVRIYAKDDTQGYKDGSAIESKTYIRNFIIYEGSSLADGILYANDYQDSTKAWENVEVVAANKAWVEYNASTNANAANYGDYRFRMQLPAGSSARSFYVNAMFDEPVSNSIIVEVNLEQSTTPIKENDVQVATKAPEILVQLPYSSSTDADGNVKYEMNTLLKMSEEYDVDGAWTGGLNNASLGKGYKSWFAFKIDLTTNTYTVWTKAYGEENDKYVQIATEQALTLNPLAEGFAPEFLRVQISKSGTYNGMMYMYDCAVYSGTEFRDDVFGK